MASRENSGTLRPMRGLTFVVAMAVGCSSADEEPAWNYSRADVESALTGTWTGTFASGRSGTLELTLRMPTPTAQPKCGNRTLSMKCMDMTEAAFEGTLTTSDAEFKDAPVRGQILITGTSFAGGWLSLTTTDGVQLSANYDRTSLRDGTLRAGDATSAFVLTRK